MKHDNSYSYKPQYDPFENVMTRNGLHADEVISALQKSIRHADEDTAIRCGYEMYVTSMELENYLWRRLSVISVEDIGFGEPTAPILIQTLKTMREEFPYSLSGSRALFLFQAIRYLCKCRKERSSDTIKTIVIEEYKRGSTQSFRQSMISMTGIRKREERAEERIWISWSILQMLRHLWISTIRN